MIKKQIILYLMTEKGFRVLEHIVRHLDIALIDHVVRARDKNLAQDYYTEIGDLCEQAGLSCLDRGAAKVAAAPAVQLKVLVVSWRWLIDLPSNTLIVMHDSLLPRYRGFAPLVNSLINGEPEIGVTALYASAEFDRGPVLGQARRCVAYPSTIAEAIEQISGCYIELVSILWAQLQAGMLPAGTPQDEDAATYSLWRDEEDYRLDWQLDAARLRRTVDALGWPYRGASTTLDGQLLRVRRAAEIPDVVIENRTPGKVLFSNADGPVVVCGQGLLQLQEVYTEGGQPALPLPKFRARLC
jgi:methionyl-tRNA formyltransferase